MWSKSIRQSGISEIDRTKCQRKMEGMSTPCQRRCSCIAALPTRLEAAGIPFMKHQTEKPSDSVMRFFTAELYVRFNSSNDDVADRANAEWEQAIEAYRSHLGQLLKKLPNPVKELAALVLHDAEIVTRFEKGPFLEAPYAPAYSEIILRQNGKLLTLIYHLWDKVEVSKVAGAWPFDKSKVHWLYDEIDTPVQSGVFFLHRVLLSDGSTLRIPFLTVDFHQVAVQEFEDKHEARRPAS